MARMVGSPNRVAGMTSGPGSRTGLAGMKLHGRLFDKRLLLSSPPAGSGRGRHVVAE